MSDFVYRLLEENWRHARLSEDRRIVITSVNIAVVSATAIAIAVTGLSRRVLPATCWAIVVGIYGLATCLRLEERAQFHALRARRLRRTLDRDNGTGAEELLEQTAEEHAARYRFLRRLRLHFAFVGLHAVIVLIGIGASVAALSVR
jgi:hypothetical protein